MGGNSTEVQKAASSSAKSYGEKACNILREASHDLSPPFVVQSPQILTAVLTLEALRA